MKKGFTLLEVIVYTAVIATIVGVVFSFFLWAVQAHAKASAKREVFFQTQRALTILQREIQESSGIYVPTTTSSQLSLLTSKYVPTGEPGGFLDFFLCGSKLCWKREGKAPVAITTDTVEVTTFSVTRIATGSIPASRITLQLEHVNPSGRPEQEAVLSVTTTASVRTTSL